MIIREAKKDRHVTREMKVSLPVDLQIRLHESKILAGDRICDVVTRALDAYFLQAPTREPQESDAA